jgi:hypothetical protein
MPEKITFTQYNNINSSAGKTISTDGYNTIVTDVTGFENAPDIDDRSQDSINTYGRVNGYVRVKERIITITITCLYNTDTGRNTMYRDAIIEGTLPGAHGDLTIENDRGIFLIKDAYVTKRTINNISQAPYIRMTTVVIEVTANKPYMLHNGEKCIDVHTSFGPASLKYTYKYPDKYNKSGKPTYVVVNNNGNTECPLLVTLNGYLNNPLLEIQQRDTGFYRKLKLNATVLPGETAYINAYTGEILVNGEYNPIVNIGDLVTDISIPPGDTVLTLSADAGSGYATVCYGDAII